MLRARAAATAWCSSASKIHHGLLMKTATQKLSKSDGDTGVRDLREKGWSAEQVIAHAATLGGLSRLR